MIVSVSGTSSSTEGNPVGPILQKRSKDDIIPKLVINHEDIVCMHVCMSACSPRVMQGQIQSVGVDISKGVANDGDSFTDSGVRGAAKTSGPREYTVRMCVHA